MAVATGSAPADQTAQDTRQPPTRKRRWWRSKSAIAAYIFIAPYVVFFMVFRILPAIFGIGLSFGEYSLSGALTFVGLEHYARLFDDPNFWGALWVTLKYAAIAMPLTVVLSLAIAQLCNRVMRGMSFYRSIFFLPAVTSPVLSGLIFVWIFSDSGPINGLVRAVGLQPISWLQDGFWVLPALALVSAWMSFGYNMLILLAGMLAIPQEYYEAASIDGANGWQRFTRITLPSLRPALFFVLVLETVKSFQTFDTIFVMTGGGPVRASYTLTFMLYDQGFGYFDFGYASAVGVVLLIIALVFSLIQRRLVGRDD
ncbi:carbohydrate ABC transporter permease [Ruania alba]|uniref:Carbohydrate ABC transporter membrane protein 1, CUT1 family n=1 Tax=Ruania alba TaxID=648782 RepID=A0A1H5MBV8_9MICO|nr:sugar ABC transporter permease [Ruania alba]SEE86796.1 carbohydrate ABC transporter membrane protein 1, CUT1 family [Ruania alba]